MPDYRHLTAMTDFTGLLQFSQGNIPNSRSGYTLDDNARALIISLHMENNQKYYTQKYLNYLDKSQMNDGSWCNYLLDGKYSSNFDSEDSIGRAIMACCAASKSNKQEISLQANQILINNIKKVHSFSSPRAIAYTLVGLCKAQLTELDGSRPGIVEELADHLLSLYTKTKSPDWLWFEDYLTYCNGILPQALFSAYSFSGNKKYLQVANDTLDFLNEILFSKGYLNIIGNHGWLKRNQPPALFDQQPVDAASIMFACIEAYQVLGNKKYLKFAKLAHQWFYGNNAHGLSLYNSQSGGCCDALTTDGLNTNQGAESTLSLIFADLLINNNIGPEFQILK